MRIQTLLNGDRRTRKESRNASLLAEAADEQFADGRDVAALGLVDQGLDDPADSALIDRFQQGRPEPRHALGVGIALRRLVAPLEPPTAVMVTVSFRW